MSDGLNYAGIVGGVVSVVTATGVIIDRSMTGRRAAAKEAAEAKRAAAKEAAEIELAAAEAKRVAAKEATAVRRDEYREIVDRQQGDIDRLDRKLVATEEAYTRKLDAMEGRCVSCQEALLECERHHARSMGRIGALELFCATKGFPVEPFVEGAGAKVQVPPPAQPPVREARP